MKGSMPCRTDVIVESMHNERRTRFEGVIAEVGEPLRRFLARRTDMETAQDVLAESFLVIWRRLEDTPGDAVLPWCYAVARNCLANEQRSARRQRGLVARIALMSPPPLVDQTPDLPDPELHQALGALRPQDRELITLWAWEDLRPTEIAAVLGITANAVNIRLHHARGRLAELLAESEGGKSRRSAGQERVKERRTP